MAGGKETPRQKMIGMMYLVLTALLALNVSKQIVMAFVVVNTGLQKSNKNAVEENTAMYQHFEKAMTNDPAKTKPYYDQAQTVKRISEKMIEDIQTIKVKLVKEVDDKNIDKNDTMLQYVDAKDNFTDPTRIMVGESEDGSGGEGKKLQDKVMEYRKQMIGVFKCGQGNIKPTDSVAYNPGLLTPPTYVADEGKRENWVIFNFSETPLVADVVTLTKLQNDVRSAEATLVNYLYGQIDATTFKVDKFKGKIIATSSYILLGDSFKADILASAIIKTKPPTIEVGDSNVNDAKGGTEIKVNADGVGRYAIRTDKEGEQKVYGLIRMENPGTGKVEAYPFYSTYMVAKPACVISPTQMNTFYAGLDNPVEISVPGAPDEGVHPSMSHGNISGQKGKYTVRCSTGDIGQDAIITVQATMPDGSKKSMPGQHFKIRRIPDPSCYTGGKSGDISMSSIQLRTVPKVEARMPADFAFNGVNFTVKSFVMAISTGGGNFVEETANSGAFTPAMLNLVTKATRGTYLIIKNVIVVGPDQKPRPITGMSIKIN